MPIILFLLQLFFFKFSVIAQEDYQSAQQTYLQQQQQYQQNYLNYIEKKDTYTKYGTITAKKEKIESAKKAIISRNLLLQYYLSALNIKLRKYADNNPTTTKKNQIEINKWIAWLKEQNAIVSTFTNQDDLSVNAKSFSKKYILIKQQIYTSLIQNQVNHYQQILQQLSQLSQDIQNNPQINDQAQNWISDLSIKKDLAQEKLKRATQLMNQNTQHGQPANSYPTSKKEILKAKQYSVQILQDLKSIIVKFYQSQ
ncbi:hypothetical protein DRH14_01255 [Candidatus Shapirobacteria bacterium]|nr:MAG: hypothetical protein DRH14_01255 [Candidatus Shapirobacteria bacterium]